MGGSAGIHHVTAICSDAKRNVAFYTGVLGLRMVKQTVNFDDPTAWHLYYGDETGRPGTALTFFARGQTPTGRNGNGMAVETAFIIPEAALGYWTQRLVERGIDHDAPEKRFGETVLPLRDPDGMRLALVATKNASEIPGWSNGEVPGEHAVRGFHGVTLMAEAPAPTAEVLTGAFGIKAAAREGIRHRFHRQADRLGQAVDILAAAGFLAGCQGAGSVHHVALRKPIWSACSTPRDCVRPISSTVATSARFISASRAACCSKLPPTTRASPSTSRRRPSALRSSCRPGTRHDAPRSPPPCRRSRESIGLPARRQNSSVACTWEHSFVLCPARLTQ